MSRYDTIHELNNELTIWSYHNILSQNKVIIITTTSTYGKMFKNVPHFKFLLSNERLDFCDFFYIKDHKD